MQVDGKSANISLAGLSSSDCYFTTRGLTLTNPMIELITLKLPSTSVAGASKASGDLLS